MSETPTPTANEEQVWASKYFMEYVRDNRFKRYMGKSDDSIIVIKENLTKKKGDTISIPLINALSGSGVTGNSILDGNEEELKSDGHAITVSYIRNAVVRTLEEDQATSINYLKAAKAALKKWSMSNLRDHIITALMAPGTNAYLASQVTGNVNYTSQANETNKDAWLAANTDRILFGAAKSNNSSNDHSASLSNVDATNDVLSTSIISLAKRMAGAATPKITPVTIKEDEEWYVMFANDLCFRDLKDDSTMTQANREAWTRGKDNPLFKGGDLIWDATIIREIAEIPEISGVGAASIDVAPNFLCGAGAVGVAWAKRPTPIFQDKDYKFRKGVGVMEMRGVEKLYYEDPDNAGSDVQHGVVTVYCAAVADT